MKLATNNGRFLIFWEDLGIALYYENIEVTKNDEKYTRKKVTRIVRDGQREWNWAVKTWGQEPQELDFEEIKLLNKMHLFAIRGVKTLSIKNRKSHSSILEQGNFFLAPESGYLISCGCGSTSRRVHQGGNGWDLFNFQQIEATQPKTKGSYCDFGTYCGSPSDFLEVTEHEMVPLTQKEWEKLSGASFSNSQEFAWFNGSICGQNTLNGIHREGDYVLMYPFRPDSKLGELVVYPDMEVIIDSYWNTTQKVNGDKPIQVVEIGNIKVQGCNQLVFVEDKGRKVYFANFQFFTFPAFWVGYETTSGDKKEAIDGLKMKAGSKMVDQINYKLRRNSGIDEKKVLGYFKNQGVFIGTPADSLSVGNCAIGTWEWMKRVFPGLLETDSVSWNHFPVSVHQEFKIPFDMMEKLFHQNYSFGKVAENIYLRNNPISGALTNEISLQLLFNPIEQSIGKIITKYEAKKLGISSYVIEDENLIRHQIEK